MTYGKTQTRNLVKELKKKKLDSLLLVNLKLPQMDPNFYYFTGLHGFENSSALIGKNSRIYVPEFELTRAERETWVKNIQKTPRKNFWKNFGKELKGKKVGINGKFIPVNFENKLRKNKIKFIDVSKILENLRIIKTKEEIALMKRSVKEAKQILNKLSHIKPENEIVAEISYELSKRKLKSAFDPIVAYDSDSAVPHFSIGSRKGGNSLLIDMGAVYEGYHSDLTRTFILDKKEKKLKEIYDVVKEAQKLAISKVRPGAKAKDVYKIAADYMKKKGHRLIHGLGHGIGLEIHEKPGIDEKSKEILKEGMIFTIEPGIYLKGKYGVRIEDDILVTKEGCRIL